MRSAERMNSAVARRKATNADRSGLAPSAEVISLALGVRMYFSQIAHFQTVNHP